jgi:pyruvate formate lyase activating enzyme
MPQFTPMSEPTGMIFDIRRFSIHDGPGIRTTAFLKGCSLNCRWCHNPESRGVQPELIYRETRCAGCGDCLAACPPAAITWKTDQPVTDGLVCTRCGTCVEACPSGARELVGRSWTVPDVMAQLRRDSAFYESSGGGVTLSGGEPLHQPEFATALLQACKTEGLHTALDTSGFCPWETMEAVCPYVDLFLYDVKLMDDDLHREFTGVSNQLILANLRRLADLGHAIILRVPLIHGITDGEGNLRAIAELARCLPNIRRVDLLPYHDTARMKYHSLGLGYPLDGDAGVAEGWLADQQQILEGYQIETRIGG